MAVEHRIRPRMIPISAQWVDKDSGQPFLETAAHTYNAFGGTDNSNDATTYSATYHARLPIYTAIPVVDINGITKAAIESVKIDEIVKRVVESHIRTVINSLGGKTVSIPASEIAPMLENVRTSIKKEIDEALKSVDADINKRVREALEKVMADAGGKQGDTWTDSWPDGKPYTIPNEWTYGEEPHVYGYGRDIRISVTSDGSTWTQIPPIDGL